MAPKPTTRSLSAEEFVANLTAAVYAIALRHAAGAPWLDLELDLWRVVAQAVQKWEAYRHTDGTEEIET